MSSPLAAALALGAAHGLPVAEPVVLKDGSNLLVHLHPAPVVVRVATFTAFIRGEPARSRSARTWPRSAQRWCRGPVSCRRARIM